MTPAWVPPAMAISLMVIALAFLAIGGGVVFLVLFVMKQVKAVKGQLQRFRDEAMVATKRLKGEIDGFADLSAETRGKIRGAIDSVETRLHDLDALVEVLQEEVEETALDAAAFVRTARRAGGVLGAAKRMMLRRRSAAD